MDKDKNKYSSTKRVNKSKLPAPKLKSIRGNITIDSEFRMLQFSPVSFIEIFLMALPMLFYLVLMYYGKDPYGDFAGILLGLGTIGIVGTLIINRKTPFKFQNYYLQNTNRILYYLIYITFTVMALGILWWLLGSVLKFGLSATELYFYYLSAAVMEEVFFRLFLCSFLKLYVFGKFKRRMPNILENLWIIIISSLLFMVSHTITYGADINAMLIMLCGGAVFAGVFLYTKDISITITAHMICNFLSVGSLLIILG